MQYGTPWFVNNPHFGTWHVIVYKLQEQEQVQLMFDSSQQADASAVLIVIGLSQGASALHEMLLR